ncbi:MAG: cobalamin-dependent protein [Geobacteraceae bacterium]|nr:cobalamin-dependent protein [Geobacteraceae bacterium]
MKQSIFNRYYEALLDTDRDQAIALLSGALDNGATPEEIVFEVVTPAIERMSRDLTKDLATTLSQHFIAAQISEEAIEMLLPLFSVAPEIRGSVVIGTSAGDFHGLGKKIVRGCLRAKMFTVVDLGVNVPAERFVDQAVTLGASIIAISAMMVHTALGADGALKVRQLLQQRGLESRIKILVGGAPFRFDQNLYRSVAADAWAENGIEATRVITELIKEVAPQ